jgi:hypothetical protein
MVYGGVETYGRDKTAQETPNTQTAVFTYSDGKMLEFECRGRYTNQEGSQGQEVGNIFYGTEGWLEISGSMWKAFRGRERKPFAGSKEGTRSRDSNHMANFIDALRSGKNEDLHCDIREGFYSTTLPHLANISCRLGRMLKFVGDNEKFANDPEADTMLTRVYRTPYVVPDKV